MKVKRTIKKITKIQKIPMDREVVKFMGGFWGRSLANAIPEEDEKTLTYSIEPDERTRLEYEFNKEIINTIKKQLSIQDKETQLNVGRLGWKMWLALIVLAYEQDQDSNKIKGKFKYADMVRLLGLAKGGKQHSNIRNVFISLSAATYIEKTKEDGQTKVKFYNLITSGEISENKNEDEAAEFHFVLNGDALGLTEGWIRWGSLSKSRQAEGYLSIPVSDLEDDTSNIYYINFRERLRLFGGRAISGYVLLHEWIKLDADKIRRRGFCAQLLNKCLQQAKAENELLDYSTELPLEKGWEQKWRVKITKQSNSLTCL